MVVAYVSGRPQGLFDIFERAADRFLDNRGFNNGFGYNNDYNGYNGYDRYNGYNDYNNGGFDSFSENNR